MRAATAAHDYVGTDRALAGIVLGVLTFWLFAQTTLNIGPLIATDLRISMSTMNIAIALSALFSGMFIVVWGGIADKYGRVKIVFIGNICSIIGALLIALSYGELATFMILLGRIFQGLAAGSIMPATMALLNTYWKGKDRQRAVSMWSIGSWGGSGLCSLFGGFMASTVFGWRSIFFLCALVSVVSILLLREVPESAPAAGNTTGLDFKGIVSFCVAMVTLQIVVTQGSAIGWTSIVTWTLLIVFFLAFGFFIVTERSSAAPFVDFALFKNPVFSGAALSNFLLNATAGVIPVVLWVFQEGAGMSPARAGYITMGYAVFIIAFIRVGEKLLQKYGPKKPMMLGAVIVLVAMILFGFTNSYVSTYLWLSVIAFCLFGLGLAFYATPSTDAALSSLPQEQAGSGSGIYKMASSLGAAFGVAISSALFTALQENGLSIIGSVLTFSGRVDNVALREAGMVGVAVNALIAVIAFVAIWTCVPDTEQSPKASCS